MKKLFVSWPFYSVEYQFCWHKQKQSLMTLPNPLLMQVLIWEM